MDDKTTPKRSDVKKLHPYLHCVVIGLDTPHKSLDEHVLYDPDIHLPVPPELIASIRENGVLVPGTARKDGEKYQIVDMRTRVRAARLVVDEEVARGVPIDEQTHIPAVIVRGNDLEMLLLSRKLNSGRKQVTLETIATYAEFMGRKYNKSIAEIAATFAVSESHVRNALALGDLGEEGAAAVATGVIKSTHGVVLAQLSREDQAVAIAEITDTVAKGGKAPTVASLNAKIRDKLGKSANTPSARNAKAMEILQSFADSYKVPGVNATRAEILALHTQAIACLDRLVAVLTAKRGGTVAKLAAPKD
jgi:ParB/RepB/Spo0J family partition protein